MNAPRRLLIVDDEPNVRLMFRTALETAGYVLEEAIDGEDALGKHRVAPADLILLDLQMPRLDGMATLQRLRDEGQDVPVVIVTAHGSIPDAVAAMRLGAIDFLSKPTTPEVLRKVVAEVLARRKPEAVNPAAKPDDDLTTQAKAALSRRDFTTAETLLAAARNRPHLAAEGHYLLGILHELREEKDGAYRSYRAALQADPHYEPARLHLLKFFNDRLM